jgi:hypothetical protein
MFWSFASVLEKTPKIKQVYIVRQIEKEASSFRLLKFSKKDLRIDILEFPNAF